MSCMKVILRISSFNSKNPSPYFPDDKFGRIRMCFDSLKMAGAEDITVLADTAEDYKIHFNGYEWINLTGYGNWGTYREQLKLAEKYDKVLLCEDDYLWRPNTIKQAEDFLDVHQLLFPYDHPGHYREGRFSLPWSLCEVKGHTYRQCPSNTLTFFTKGKTIKNNIEVFAGYGTFDHELFTALRERFPIWTPCYSMATHLVSDLLAPNVDWNQFANLYS